MIKQCMLIKLFMLYIAILMASLKIMVITCFENLSCIQNSPVMDWYSEMTTNKA